jgi:hypothetical protein
MITNPERKKTDSLSVYPKIPQNLFPEPLYLFLNFSLSSFDLCGVTMCPMLYFAYGSNMCAGRLRERVPSAMPVRIAKLLNHTLRFHKRSDKDGSGKADAFFTGERENVIWGVVFEFDPAEKADLDKHEGLGRGYAERQITVIDVDGNHHPTFMYGAEAAHIDPALRPYSWYKRFVIDGARQHYLPPEYIATIEALEAIADPKQARDAENRSIQC